MLPLNNCSRAAHSFFKIDCLFSFFALLCLFIPLPLLTSDNVHSKSSPIFPCSVCTGNVSWQDKSMQCCTCSKWVHLRCSQHSVSNFRALRAFPCRNTVTPSSDMYTSIVQSGPPLLMMWSCPTLVLKPLIPHQPILCFLYLPLHHRPLHSWLSFYASCLLSPTDSLRVLQWNCHAC